MAQARNLGCSLLLTWPSKAAMLVIPPVIPSALERRSSCVWFPVPLAHFPQSQHVARTSRVPFALPWSPTVFSPLVHCVYPVTVLCNDDRKPGGQTFPSPVLAHFTTHDFVTWMPGPDAGPSAL